MQAPTYACDTAAHLCRYPAIVRSQEAWKDKSEREKRERERERERAEWKGKGGRAAWPGICRTAAEARCPFMGLVRCSCGTAPVANCWCVGWAQRVPNKHETATRLKLAGRRRSFFPAGACAAPCRTEQSGAELSWQ